MINNEEKSILSSQKKSQMSPSPQQYNSQESIGSEKDEPIPSYKLQTRVFSFLKKNTLISKKLNMHRRFATIIHSQ